RHGEDSCFVTAAFDVTDNPTVKGILEDYSDETPDDELIISRKLTSDGKSQIRVNGEAYSASMLKGITGYLIDVHGQSDHYSLLKSSEQLKVLDKFCKKELESEFVVLKEIISALKTVDEELKRFGGSESERAIRADILKFQIDEIENADIRDGEEEELLEKRKKIQNAEKISEAFSQAKSALTEENCALDCLSGAVRAISGISSLDKRYAEFEERLKAAYSEIEDVSESIADVSDDFDFDEAEADKVESRLDLIKNLKKKYGASASQIEEFLTEAKREYEKLINFDVEYAKFSAQKAKLIISLNSSYKKITDIRRKFSLDFCKRVTEQLKALGMKHANFEITFSEKSEVENAPYPENGNDEVEFNFSANLGEPVKPLSKIISGGEMSRFMLALKVITSGYHDISTYVFDEIDVGISGATAEVVAKKFADISRKTQVLAISHLPVVCAMSDVPIKISKIEENGKTVTVVKNLSKSEKIYEIMRIMSGENASDIAYKHAEETVNSCDAYKSRISSQI
ncbi:MAG: DNA repair protein RecN, partial [Eubacteriales bacterium]|nr:DNA repair protein RecN [Eubacteriales bacterium]